MGFESITGQLTRVPGVARQGSRVQVPDWAVVGWASNVVVAAIVPTRRVVIYSILNVVSKMGLLEASVDPGAVHGGVSLHGGDQHSEQSK